MEIFHQSKFLWNIFNKAAYDLVEIFKQNSVIFHEIFQKKTTGNFEGILRQNSVHFVKNSAKSTKPPDIPNLKL